MSAMGHTQSRQDATSHIRRVVRPICSSINCLYWKLLFGLWMGKPQT